MFNNSTTTSKTIEFDKICRGCLGKKGDMRPLFGSCLDSMLRETCAINIYHGDGLPDLMCVQCVLSVSRAFTFKQQCEKNDKCMRLYISQTKKQVNNAAVSEEVIISDVSELIETHPEEIPGGIEFKMENDNLEQNIVIVHHSSIEPQSLEGEEIISTEEDDICRDQVENSTYDDEQSNENTENVMIEFDDLNSITTIDVQSGKIVENYETYQSTADIPIVLTVKDQIFDESTIKLFCVECGIEFSNEVDLQSHQFIEHSIGEAISTCQCTVCHKVFSETKILKRHMKTHMKVKPHLCLQCGMSFAESSNLTKHKKKHTGELRNVVGKHHLCNFCGKRFKWASSLSKHMKHHTKHKILNCPYCPKYYVEARSLNIHIRSHTGEKPYECTICNKAFTQMCNLEKHTRVHTGEKPFLCNICGKRFSQSGYVAIHVRTHTGEKPYECTDCGKCFAGSNTLAIHKRTHTGEKNYCCNICGKAFARQETLNIHTRSHTGEKPFICEICNRGFSSSGHLCGHMRSHNGTKQHQCTVCERRFAGSSSLKVHMKSHNNDKPFICNLCGTGYNNNSALAVHMLTHKTQQEFQDDDEYLQEEEEQAEEDEIE